MAKLYGMRPGGSFRVVRVTLVVAELVMWLCVGWLIVGAAKLWRCCASCWPASRR